MHPVRAHTHTHTHKHTHTHTHKHTHSLPLHAPPGCQRCCSCTPQRDKRGPRPICRAKRDCCQSRHAAHAKRTVRDHYRGRDYWGACMSGAGCKSECVQNWGACICGVACIRECVQKWGACIRGERAKFWSVQNLEACICGVACISWERAKLGCMHMWGCVHK